MAEKSILDIITDELARSGFSNEQQKVQYPILWKLINSSLSKDEKENAIKEEIKNGKIKKELEDFDFFDNFDYSKIENGETDSKDLKKADMASVKDWYGKARKAIDPTGIGSDALDKTPLYKIVPKIDLRKDNADYSAFEYLEDPNNGNDFGWFDNLLKEFDYPDTPEGWDQLANDWNTVMSRMKWSDKADKYPGIVSFMEGNSMKKMKNGFRPEIKDYVADLFTNLSYMVPSGSYLKFLQKAKLAPSPKALEIIKDVDGTILKEPGLASSIWGGLAPNMIAPIVSSTAKYATDKDYGVSDSFGDVLLGTVVNKFTPLEHLLGLVSNPLEKMFKNEVRQGRIPEAIKNLNQYFGEKLPTYQAFIDNKLGNDVFSEYLKERLIKPLKNRYIGKDDEK
ncbi:MAG: hypothetical protein MJY87_02380 [Fibrobacter sp.]|nr:hypothetical protein [Fibrobacter sp.]